MAKSYDLMSRAGAEAYLMDTMKNIAKHHPDMVMTAHRAKLYKLIQRSGSMTTSEIYPVMKRKHTVQTLSTMLKRMYREEWLTREEVAQESGGIEWVYSISVNS